MSFSHVLSRVVLHLGICLTSPWPDDTDASLMLTPSVVYCALATLCHMLISPCTRTAVDTCGCPGELRAASSASLQCLCPPCPMVRLLLSPSAASSCGGSIGRVPIVSATRQHWSPAVGATQCPDPVIVRFFCVALPAHPRGRISPVCDDGAAPDRAAAAPRTKQRPTVSES